MKVNNKRNMFNEATRVQMPAMVHLTRLGYTYFGKISEEMAGTIYDPDTNILIDVFKKKFAQLNPERAGEAMQVLREIRQELDNDDLGRAFYTRLTSVSPVKLIDFEELNKNDYHFTAEFTCKNGQDEFRPDITLFVNGLPIAFIEVKKPNNKGGMVAESKRMNRQRFPNKKFRNYFYKVSLTPKITMELTAKFSEIYKILKEGESYFSLGNNCRINYIMKIVQIFNEIEKIKIDKKFDTIKKHIEWWFSKDKTLFTGTASNHYDFISKEFLYKFTRNIGAFISLCLLNKDDLKGNQKEKTGLPWIIFWLKDIITWGTLDPVTAYIMANDSSVITRVDAQKISQNYYNNYGYINNDEIFNPDTIKKWYHIYKIQYNKHAEEEHNNEEQFQVKLDRNFILYTQLKYRVIPIIKNNKIYWIDIAGYIMAVSDIGKINVYDNDYILYPKEKRVISSKYLS